MIETARLRLRWWRDADRDAHAALCADPRVMADLGGPRDRAGSDLRFDSYLAALDSFGFARWSVEDKSGVFLGYVGVMPRRGDHPLGDHDEIGWRLNRHAWGHGYALEAAKAALDDVFTRVGLTEVIAYTAPDNHRSKAVIRRLRMRRDRARDFTVESDLGGAWSGEVWVAPLP
ncbi:GNAT family N-acetyltransferase [Hoeflea sp.]|uniref:GNAT family N-acetyltransferase n=1 Tax=Hoeflea sp. TaxID=1940281 RepID=UPI003B0293D2